MQRQCTLGVVFWIDNVLMPVWIRIKLSVLASDPDPNLDPDPFLNELEQFKIVYQV
jgi:hypothetical protein